jgi:hypothetical protein
MMYTIDFMTCSADDVIARSVVCHPSMLADQLCATAAIHERSAAEMHDRLARETAERMARDARTIADRLANGGTGELTHGQTIIVFSAAARLQCISHGLAADIVGRAPE